MAEDSVTLIGGIRQNLLAIQRASAARGVAERNLSTGRRVNSAADDAVAYFQAKALSDRTTDLAGIKSSINQAVSTLGAASDGVRGVGRLLDQLKGLALAARGADESGRAELARQFNDLRGQVDLLARDAGYQGVNLLSTQSAELRVEFETGDLTVAPRDVSAAGLGVAAANVSTFDFEAALGQVEAATSQVRSIEQALNSSLGALTTRGDYTASVMNTLKAGEDKLTLADAGEEAARLVSIRTRRQLGMTALAIANDSQRSLLALF
ncbi:MAG: hypothetical protein AB1918_01295 [Pseudomonadota bacterium]